MPTYIKRNVKRFYVTTAEELPENIAGGVGSTWDDYLGNKYVPLCAEQLEFRQANPGASVKEVFDMSLASARERTLQDAKNEKTAQIARYDNGTSVNGFTVNGAIEAWFTVQERLNYKESINAAKLLGKDEVTFFIGEAELTVNCDAAIGMLAQIQDYADRCYLVTKRHKLAVAALETIEAVDAYDHTAGYPDRLQFTVG